MQLDEHDRDKLAAEDIRMQSKDESKVVENTNEPNATAKDDKRDSPKFQSVLQPGKLEAIPEGEDEDGVDAFARDDDAMPELNRTYESDDEMDIDLTGNHDTADMSGIPELTEDILVDQDVIAPDEQARPMGEDTVPGGTRLVTVGNGPITLGIGPKIPAVRQSGSD